MDIIVATPGRLLDFIESKLILLKKIKYLIIDEADRILEMGFEQQLNAIIYEKGKEIYYNINNKLDLPDKTLRQNLMFSATFSFEVRNIAKKFMNDFYYVSRSSSDESTQNANINHEIVYLEENDKLLYLHERLQKLKGLVISKLNF